MVVRDLCHIGVPDHSDSAHLRNHKGQDFIVPRLRIPLVGRLAYAHLKTISFENR